MMNIKNDTIIPFLFLPALLFCNKVSGQQITGKASIDSLVDLCQNALGMPVNNDDDLIAFYLKEGDGVNVFTPAKHLFVVCEFKSEKDTIFIKEFYSFNQKLIYLKEEHFIYNPDLIMDTIQNKHFKMGYESYYYVIDGFFAGGNASYSYDFSTYNYAPEPVTFITKMIKQNEVYLRTK